MKAVVYTQYGAPEVLHMAEVAKPAPKDNEVLIRVRAVSVGFGDLIARRFRYITPREFNMPFIFWLPARLAFGFFKPSKPILGSDFAGEVTAVGKAVQRFKVGDAVFGFRGQAMGANAEYVCMAEDSLVEHKPSALTFEEAAAVPYGALTALSLLQKADIQPGQRVLINGASGGIGSYAVQLAKAYGAVVTGVCSTPRVGLVKALGADTVIDYTRDDFTRNGQTYDLIIDVLGRLTFGRAKRALQPHGRLLYVSFKMKQLLQMLWSARGNGKRVICGLSSERQEDLKRIKDMVEAGKIKAIIDRCYPLEQAADAHRYAEAGQKTGHIILTLASRSL